jgi:hypothetical protein
MRVSGTEGGNEGLLGASVLLAGIAGMALRRRMRSR